MKRRQFLAMSAIAPFAGVALAEDAKHEDYTREAYEQALATGEPFLLDFSAPW